MSVRKVLYMLSLLVRSSPKTLLSCLARWGWRETFLDGLIGCSWCHSLKMTVCSTSPSDPAPTNLDDLGTTILIVDPLWTLFIRPRSDSHVTRSATSGGPSPIQRGHPSMALQLAWGPLGSKQPSSEGLSLADCVSQWFWIWKDDPKTICNPNILDVILLHTLCSLLYLSYYNARGLFVCSLFKSAPLQNVPCTRRGARGMFLGDWHATTCTVAEECAKYF